MGQTLLIADGFGNAVLPSGWPRGPSLLDHDSLEATTPVGVATITTGSSPMIHGLWSRGDRRNALRSRLNVAPFWDSIIDSGGRVALAQTIWPINFETSRISAVRMWSDQTEFNVGHNAPPAQIGTPPPARMPHELQRHIRENGDLSALFRYCGEVSRHCLSIAQSLAVQSPDLLVAYDPSIDIFAHNADVDRHSELLKLFTHSLLANYAEIATRNDNSLTVVGDHGSTPARREFNVEPLLRSARAKLGDSVPIRPLTRAPWFIATGAPEAVRQFALEFVSVREIDVRFDLSQCVPGYLRVMPGENTRVVCVDEPWVTRMGTGRGFHQVSNDANRPAFVSTESRGGAGWPISLGGVGDWIRDSLLINSS